MNLYQWSQTLADYRNCSESELSEWTDQDIFYLLPISTYAESLNSNAKNLFKKDANDTLRKWRTPGTTLPRIYPSEKDWKEGIAFTILGQGKHHPLAIWEPLSFNFLKGISEKGKYTSKYFIIEHQVGEFCQSLQEL